MFLFNREAVVKNERTAVLSPAVKKPRYTCDKGTSYQVKANEYTRDSDGVGDAENEYNACDDDTRNVDGQLQFSLDYSAHSSSRSLYEKITVRRKF
jgi:hypothetical protein